MITNNTNLSLPLAMFLVMDDYDHVSKSNYISATSLLRPIKATILQGRLKGEIENDVLDFVASRVGTSAHDRLEKAFLNGNHVKNMRKLGYPEDIISRTKINPVNPHEADIPIYLEKRTIKELNGYLIGGKFDTVVEDTVRDLKTTKVFKWIKGDFEEYELQGSIYRWLNPDIIKNDYMYIDFIFTDWKKFEAKAKKEYPQYPAQSKRLPLLSLEDTEKWISGKLTQITSLIDKDQDELPECTQKELWQDEPKYAYFKNPLGKRATKVFSNLLDANTKLLADGSVGKIDTRNGTPKRCNYCNARPICNQYAQFVNEGLMK